MPCPIPEFKKGQTFNAIATYTTEPGWPADLSGCTIESDIKDSRNQLRELTVVIDSPTQFTMSATGEDTQDWYPGTAYWDIKFVQSGVTFYSETVTLNILANITPNN